MLHGKNLQFEVNNLQKIFDTCDLGGPWTFQSKQWANYCDHQQFVQLSTCDQKLLS